jgi:dTDP-4-amino-4,6-dideoxygalactose transaminase
VPASVDPVWHLYVVRVAERDTIRRQLGEHGIQTGVHYPVPIHLQKAYCDLGYKQGDFPITEAVSNEILSLPMYPELTPDMIAYVVQTLETLTQPVEQAN